MPKKTYQIQYRYDKIDHWSEYDSTQVESWRDIQFERMQKEHPKAEHRISVKK